MAIFASAANAHAQNPVMGMSVGMGIWVVVLTIIAMYVAGRETGRLAAVTNRHDGLVHGMIMFGLSVAAALVITTIAGSGWTGTAGLSGSTHNPYLLDMFSGLGWFAFFAFFLGWLAASEEHLPVPDQRVRSLDLLGQSKPMRREGELSQRPEMAGDASHLRIPHSALVFRERKAPRLKKNRDAAIGSQLTPTYAATFGS